MSAEQTHARTKLFGQQQQQQKTNLRPVRPFKVPHLKEAQHARARALGTRIRIIDVIRTRGVRDESSRASIRTHDDGIRFVCMHR